MHTQRTRQVFLNPEPDIYLSMVQPACRHIDIQLTRPPCPQIVTLPPSPADAATPPVPTVQDGNLQAMLKQAYDLYRLLHGPATATLDAYGRLALIDAFGAFFPSYLAAVDVVRADLLDALLGVQFLPLDKNTYLRTQCFINQTEALFPCGISVGVGHKSQPLLAPQANRVDGVSVQQSRRLERPRTGGHAGALPLPDRRPSCIYGGVRSGVKWVCVLNLNLSTFSA